MAGPLDPAAALAALRRINFDWTRSLGSVWRDAAADVPELNGDIAQKLAQEFAALTTHTADGNPLGRVVIGQAGAGKTHLLGRLRQDVWRQGGWFVLLDLLDVTDFWETAAECFVLALGQPMHGWRSQGEVLLDRLRARLRLRRGILARLRLARAPRGKPVAEALLARLRRLDPTAARTHREVVLAFAMMLSGEPEQQDAAGAWLRGAELDAAELRALGLRGGVPPRRVVEGLSWLMALTGPTVCAIDQIDAIVSVAHALDAAGAPANAVQRRAVGVIDGLAGGLMALREVTQRTMTVLSTLPATWEVLNTRALASFQDRFQPPQRLAQITRADLARRVVEARVARPYGDLGFAAPYASWPFRPEAFANATAWSPRELLQACEAHRAACLDRGEVTELERFFGPAPAAVPVPASDFGARYSALQDSADPAALDAAADEAPLVALLHAALRVWMRRTVWAPGQDVVLDEDLSGLHARLRLVDGAAGTERHLSFCVISAKTAIAVQKRLRDAISVSGIDAALPFRRLLVLRREAWPGGQRTGEMVQRFEAAEGRKLWPTDADLRRMQALRVLLAEAPPGLENWLRDLDPGELPAWFAELDRFSAAPLLPPPPDIGPLPAESAPPPIPAAVALRIVSSSTAPAAALPLGERTADRRPVSLPLRLLPQHIAVMAGSGSGKTVFLRRLIEEAALAGIPSIVLDSNNDLVRLADPWPGRPDGFSEADAARAKRYFAVAEAVVWTPGRGRGNPLSLAPLPDFAALEPEADERELAVGMAAAALQPMVSATGATGNLRMGVLNDVLRHFARTGGGRLDDLVALLRDLPPEASRIDRAAKLAADLANALLAAQSRNPLLDGAGPPLDPAVLLGGRPGRVRISVVNLAGLPGEAARQDFVGRLLMALFGHVRRHPASAARPVVGLLVMDEAQNFAPSGSGAPSRGAAVALARQARKYGLGMVFATQGPRAIDTSLIGNCTTQLFGRTNAPAAIETARDMLASRGGAADDLGRLAKGVFYLTTEGTDRPQKLQTPLCLSYHPANPPTEDEVIERAARSRAALADPG